MWFEECYNGACLRIKGKKIFEKITKYQKIEVYDTEIFGRMLVLDGTVQLTERDEHIYHEALAHIPLYTHPHPRRVLIIGGGDGGVVRECVKHGCEVNLVEIDAEVIEISKKYFPTIAKYIEQARIVIMDGFEYLKKCDEKYDVIIVDSTDPVGEAEKLFGEDFYHLVKKCLSDDGIVAMQLGSFWYHTTHIKKSIKFLRGIFQHVKVFTATIPTYPGGYWIFGISSDKEIVRRRDCRIDTKYYSDDIYYSSFSLPKFVKEEMGI